MKKTLSIIASLFALLAVSCTSEKLETPAADGREVTVSFTAELPAAIATKAYSDGTTATNLRYALYEADSKTLLYSSDQLDVQPTFTNRKASVSLTLVTGKTYDLLFWAYSPNNKTYTVDLQEQTLKVDYDLMVANDETNDAFYAFEDNLSVDGAISKEIQLFRPFAQINLGTNDLNSSNEGFVVGSTSMAVAKVADVLDFSTGNVSGEVDATFAAGAIPTGETFPVNNYEYLEMNYLLVGKDQTTVDCAFGIYKEGSETATNTINVANVPVKRNFRTNIYGSLITDPADLEIEVKPGMGGEDNDVVIGDATFEAKVAEINANTNDTEFEITIATNVKWDTKTEGNGAAMMFSNPEATITINGNGNTFTAVGAGSIRSAAKVIFNNVVFVDNTSSYDENSWEWGYMDFGYEQEGKYEFNNCVFENSVMFNSEVAATDCTFKGASYPDADHAESEYAAWVSALNSSFENCTFSGLYRGIKVCKLYHNEAQIMTVDACTFENISKKPGVAIDCAEGSVITIKNSSFTNVQPGDQSKYIYETDNIVPVLENNKLYIGNGEYLYENGTLKVGGNAELQMINTLADETVEEVVLTEDISGKAEANGGGYGKTGITHINGNIFNGGENTLTVTDANSTWDSAIFSKGGTIKNLNINGGFRGILIGYETEKVIIDNVTINPGAYTISVDGANGHGLEVKNSTINGWTSFTAAIGEASFTNCKFGSNGDYAYMRPYAVTVLKDCVFSEDYELDARSSSSITLENCYVGETLITAENITSLLGSDAEKAIVK